MSDANVTYPIDPPAMAQWRDVVPGVRWIRLPMPFSLDHINVWALDDGDGWALVDTGVRTDQVVETWESLLASAPFNRPLKRVFVTHMHPDHIGMAGWLTRRFDVQLWISALEYLSCRALVSDTQREAPPDALRFYAEAGWHAVAIEKYRTRFGGFGKLIYTLPDSYRRLQDGQRITIGAHEWEVVTGNGHSPEHACLYCAEQKLLISGDQVLAKISSNVSVYPIEPEANPMADWLASIEKLRTRIPDDVLVLPAHDNCFRGLHARLKRLHDGQMAAFTRLRGALQQPQRVIDVFGSLFSRPIDPSSPNFHLATGETIACLNYLMQQGEVVKELRDGVAWYRLTC